MASFQAANTVRSTLAVSDREQQFFGNGFTFDQEKNLYGNTDTTIVLNPEDIYGELRTAAKGTDIVRQISPPPDVAKGVAIQAEHALFPLRGHEDERLAQASKLDGEAWEHALAAIPGLSKIGVNADVLKALVRNELHYYDPKDSRDDREAQSGKDPGRTATLGIAQISQKGIAEFERDIPAFKQFLESMGYTGPGHELRALEDPTCAPMIVAAKLASLAKSYEAHNTAHPDHPVQINATSLIYGYNADVQAHSENGKINYKSMPDQQAALERLIHQDLHKAYPSSDPDVLNASNHVAHVLEQLRIIQSQHK